jgi:hypothetical protein
MFGQESAGQVSHTEANGRLVLRRDQVCRPARSKAHKARRLAPGGGAKFAFIDQTKLAQHRQTVCHHRKGDKLSVIAAAVLGGMSLFGGKARSSGL